MKTFTLNTLGILLLATFIASAQPPPGFFLVNTDNYTEIGPLGDGDTINWAEFGSVNLGILLYPDEAPGGVFFTLRGPIDHNQAEGASSPYSLFGDIGVVPNGRLFPIGDYYLRAKPINGEAWEINFSVIEEDPVCATGMDTEPPVARCKDATLTLDVNGFASLSVSHIDNGSTDNCGIQSRSHQSEFTEVGVFPVVLTVRDFSGNVNTCISMVTVEPYDPSEPVAGLILVDADSDTEIIKLAPNIKINKDLIGDGPVGIIYNPAEPPGGVNFKLRGPVNETRSEGANPPYSVFGDIGLDIQGKSLPVGSYTIEANPNFGETLWIGFEIVESYLPGAFVTTWKTDNPGPSPANRITIPTYPGETYNYTVDWGDGSTTPGYTGDATHTYSNPGTYTVSITGQFPGINFGRGTFPFQTDREKILLVNQWGNIQWQRMDNAYISCPNLDVVAVDVPNLSEVTSLDSMFQITDQFKGNEAFNSWDTSTIISMFYTFGNSQFNAPIGNWNVSNVTNMAGMFENAEVFNQAIGNWDISNVTNMAFMFDDAISFNQDLGNWDVSNVTDMNQMFLNAEAFNQDVGNWNVSNVVKMTFLFGQAILFNQDLSNWDTSNVENMEGMFALANEFNQDISTWDVSNVQNMARMFAYNQSFDQNLGNWDVSSVNSMSGMFEETGLSTTNYDATLMGWSALPSLQPGVTFDAGFSQYCSAEAERAQIINDYNWVINDGGQNCTGIGLYGFRLVDAETDKVITGNALIADTFFFLDRLPESITFDIYRVLGPVESVRLEIAGPINSNRIENVPPFSLFGDIAGDYFGRSFVEGDYTLMATPYSGDNGTGVTGPIISINFSMVYESTNLKTPSVASLRLSPNPASTFVGAVLNESKPIQKMMLFDIQGRLLKEISGRQAALGQMQISEFPAGIYILKTISASGSVSEEQMVIER